MTKQLSQHAAAAKAIRAELKKNGIKASVRASSASMTSAVRVELIDELPATVEQIDAFASQFQYGHFDGMTDCYEYSNSRDDIPQVKHVFVNVSFSDEIRQAAWDYARATYAELADAPESRHEAHTVRICDMWGDMFLNQILHGRENICGGRTFWTDHKPRVSAA